MIQPASKSLPTIWQVPDELWNKLNPILTEHDPPKPTGRKRIDARAALDTIIFWLRSGCQWNQPPNEFPDDSSVHRTFQRWENFGVLDRIWAALIEECDELGGVDWQCGAGDAPPPGKVQMQQWQKLDLVVMKLVQIN
jgi:putative transposase